MLGNIWTSVCRDIFGVLGVRLAGPVADYFGLTAGHQISNQQRQGLQRRYSSATTHIWHLRNFENTFSDQSSAKSSCLLLLYLRDCAASCVGRPTLHLWWRRSVEKYIPWNTSLEKHHRHNPRTTYFAVFVCFFNPTSCCRSGSAAAEKCEKSRRLNPRFFDCRKGPRLHPFFGSRCWGQQHFATLLYIHCTSSGQNKNA